MLEGQKIVVIGGSSGIGLATARAALKEGAVVTICARSLDRLRAEAEKLQGNISIARVDVGDERQVADLFASTNGVDHILITAGSLPDHGSASKGPQDIFPEASLRGILDNRLLAAMRVVRHAVSKVRPGGSITFSSGVAAVRPVRGEAFLSACCAAIEVLARGLAVDLAPVRFNTLRPGLIATPLLERAFGSDGTAHLEAMTQRLPPKRLGRSDEVADAALFIMKNEYVTGTSLTVDGGFQSL